MTTLSASKGRDYLLRYYWNGMEWDDQVKYAKQLDDQLWLRVLKSIQKELFKEERPPRTEDELISFKEHTGRLQNQSMWWRFVPHRKQGYFIRARSWVRCPPTEPR